MISIIARLSSPSLLVPSSFLSVPVAVLVYVRPLKDFFVRDCVP